MDRVGWFLPFVDFNDLLEMKSVLIKMHVNEKVQIFKITFLDFLYQIIVIAK